MSRSALEKEGVRALKGGGFRRQEMHARTRLGLTIVALLLVLAGTLALAGCGSRNKDQQTISSNEGLFHIKAPASWQKRVDERFIGLYASDKLPTSEKLESLSIVILSGSSTSTTPTAQLLSEFAKERGRTRKWKAPDIGDPQNVEVGGRPASRVAVAGSDSNGAFGGAYYLIRTASSDVLVMAVAPKDDWEADEAQVSQLTRDWFWHEAPSKKSSGAPKP